MGIQTLCTECPSRTPFRADPECIQRARELQFEPPLDEGIRDAVILLVSQGIETFESCQGGEGHCFPEPTIRFEGGIGEGLRAVAIALAHGLPIFHLRRAWGIRDGLLHGPWWEVTFTRPVSEPSGSVG